MQCTYLVLACRTSIDRSAVHHIRQTGKTVSNQSATPPEMLVYVAAKLQQLTASVHHKRWRQRPYAERCQPAAGHDRANAVATVALRRNAAATAAAAAAAFNEDFFSSRAAAGEVNDEGREGGGRTDSFLAAGPWLKQCTPLCQLSYCHPVRSLHALLAACRPSYGVVEVVFSFDTVPSSHRLMFRHVYGLTLSRCCCHRCNVCCRIYLSVPHPHKK